MSYNTVCPPFLKKVVAGQYQVGPKLGSGSFGDVYEGYHIASGTPVAIKVEPLDSDYPQLEYETRLYRQVNPHNTEVGFPAMYWCGTDSGFNVMITEMLGPSLEDLFNYCGRRFSVKTVLMLADQMISRMEHFHNSNLIHRDLKPDNFLMGTYNKGHHVYLIDFGLSKKYRDGNGTHVPAKEGKPLIGTARYASINSHYGREQGRRDDMESLAYIFAYLVHGSLPWQGITPQGADKVEKFRQIANMKYTTPVESMFSKMPMEFGRYYNYVRALKFDEKPEYGVYRTMLNDALQREGGMDFIFDWTKKKYNPELYENQHEEYNRRTGSVGVQAPNSIRSPKSRGSRRR